MNFMAKNVESSLVKPQDTGTKIASEFQNVFFNTHGQALLAGWKKMLLGFWVLIKKCKKKNRSKLIVFVLAPTFTPYHVFLERFLVFIFCTTMKPYCSIIRAITRFHTA